MWHDYHFELLQHHGSKCAIWLPNCTELGVFQQVFPGDQAVCSGKLWSQLFTALWSQLPSTAAAAHCAWFSSRQTENSSRATDSNGILGSRGKEEMNERGSGEPAHYSRCCTLESVSKLPMLKSSKEILKNGDLWTQCRKERAGMNGGSSTMYIHVSSFQGGASGKNRPAGAGPLRDTGSVPGRDSDILPCVK